MNFRGASVSRAKSQSRTFLRQRWPPCCHGWRARWPPSNFSRASAMIRDDSSLDREPRRRLLAQGVIPSLFLFHGIEGSGFWNFPRLPIFGIGNENEGRIDGWATFSIVWSFDWFSFSRARWNSISRKLFFLIDKWILLSFCYVKITLKGNIKEIKDIPWSNLEILEKFVLQFCLSDFKIKRYSKLMHFYKRNIFWYLLLLLFILFVTCIRIPFI